MKKFTLSLVILSIAVFLFCCKTYKDAALPEEEIVDTEISDYLNSAKGVMHNAPVPQANSNKGTAGLQSVKENPLSLRTYKVPEVVKEKIKHDEPVLTKKEERKAIKKFVKKHLAGDDEVGIAVGLLILYIILIALVVVGLIYLIAAAANNASNSSSNGGSGSGSNSTGSGNSGNSGGSGSNSGCYVATMVYGSYDAPEVMVLRRFRDNTLSNSKAGRAFIRWYYSWSPGFVAKYHHLSWLHSIIKVVLNRLVKFLS
jgi:hypothetical protein